MSALGNKAIFSKNLKKYIAMSGKDRRELADIWGFPYSTVSEWVNGRKYPRIDRIEVMADYFGISKSDLIEDNETLGIEKSATNDGLTEGQKQLIDFARSLPEDKAALALRLLQSIVEGD